MVHSLTDSYSYTIATCTLQLVGVIMKGNIELLQKLPLILMFQLTTGKQGHCNNIGHV